MYSPETEIIMSLRVKGMTRHEMLTTTPLREVVKPIGFWWDLEITP